MWQSVHGTVLSLFKCCYVLRPFYSSNISYLKFTSVCLFLCESYLLAYKKEKKENYISYPITEKKTNERTVPIPITENKIFQAHKHPHGNSS